MNDSTTSTRHKTKAELERSVMAILLDEEIPETKPSVNPDETRTLIIDDLVPYATHPFKLYEGARLDDMVRSIKENGVIVPIVTRPLNLEEDTYEILSGHNRVNAAKLAGLTKVPAIVKEKLSDDEARLIVTETNLMQRSFADLSHSERAITLKHHMEAIKAQGKRTDFTDEVERLSNPYGINENEESGLIVPKMESRDKVAEKYNLDARSVSRYIRLSFLTTGLLSRVDSGEIGLYPAVSLSYLSLDEQAELDRLLGDTTSKVDMKKANTLRAFSADEKLTDENMVLIISGKLNRKPKPKFPPLLKIKHKVYSKFFNTDIQPKEMEAIIEQALTEYFANHKKQEGEDTV